MKKIFLTSVLLVITWAQNANWQKLNCPPGTAISAIVINSNDYFAATNISGIIQAESPDFNWSPLNNGIDYLEIQDLTISSNGKLIAASGAGIYLFDSQISSWVSLSAPPIIILLSQQLRMTILLLVPGLVSSIRMIVELHGISQHPYNI